MKLNLPRCHLCNRNMGIDEKIPTLPKGNLKGDNYFDFICKDCYKKNKLIFPVYCHNCKEKMFCIGVFRYEGKRKKYISFNCINCLDKKRLPQSIYHEMLFYEVDKDRKYFYGIQNNQLRKIPISEFDKMKKLVRTKWRKKE